MKKYYLLSFLLGMVVYNFLPKDASVEVPDKAPRVKDASMVVASEGKCVRLAENIVVDGTIISGPEKVNCRK